MAEHTPGPWTAEPCNHGGILVRRGGPLWHPQHSLLIVPAADARLIAAAPDMLAALIALGQSLDFDDPLQPGDLSIEDPSSVNAAFAQARAAIAKATGSLATGEPANGERE